MRKRLQSMCGGRQRGAAAIEFALAFPLFFGLFYAMVGYGLVLTLEQSLTEASKEGARRALRVDPTAYGSLAEYQSSAAADARATVAEVLDWLPAAQQAAILGTAPGYANIGVTFPGGARIRVQLTYPYSSAPLLPVLTFPVIGNIPSIPDNLSVYADALL